MKKKPYIDLAKGIVILFVILGHLVPFNKTIWLWIFSFHMPFFFIISGFSSSEKTYCMPFKEFLLKCIRTVLIPALFIRIVYQFVGVAGVDFNSKMWIKDLFLNYYYPLSEWFIMSLFFAKILFYILHRFINKSIKNNKILVYILAISVSFFAGELYKDYGLHGKPNLFPIPIDCSLIALAFVIFGYLLKQSFDSIKKQVDFRHLSIVFVLLLWLIKYQTYTNVCDMYFGRSSISYYVFACYISFYILVLCDRICSKKESGLMSSIIQLVGRNTIIIYPGHTIIFFLLNKYIYLHTGIMYVPMHYFKTYLIFVYFFISVIFLLPICYVYEKITKKIDFIKKICLVFVIIYSFLLIGVYYFGGYSNNQSNEKIIINTVDDFCKFRDSVNAGNDYKGFYICQNKDLDLREIDNFEPIGVFGSNCYFRGVYDGCGHSIMNLKIKRDDNCALFSMLGGTVCNLKIESGIIEGQCVGTIASHATDDGNAKIINCINYADVHGSVRAGGIADNFDGLIVSCVNMGDCFSDSGEIGGIVSYKASEIRNCLSNVNLLYPSDGNYKNNFSIETFNNKLIRKYNYYLGLETKQFKLKLYPVRYGEEFFYIQSDKTVIFGEITYIIKSRLVDLVLFMIIVTIRNKKKIAKKI